MTMGPDQTFSEKWNAEAQDEYKQMRSVLFDYVTVFRNRGKTYHVPIWNQAEANIGRQRNQMLEVVAQDTEDVPITTQLINLAFVIDDYDQAQSDIDHRRALTRQAVGAVWRAFDDIVIAQLNTAVNQVTLPTANTFNYNASEAVAASLDRDEVLESDRFGVISSGAKTDLRRDTTYINNFHMKNEVVEKGIIKDAAGIDYKTSQRLPNGAGGSTERRNFAWHKMAVGVYINKPFRLNIAFENMFDGHSLVATMGVGAKIIQQKGVRFFDTSEP